MTPQKRVAITTVAWKRTALGDSKNGPSKMRKSRSVLGSVRCTDRYAEYNSSVHKRRKILKVGGGGGGGRG
jgi:hypothetical protein